MHGGTGPSCSTRSIMRFELQLLDQNPGRKLKWRNPAASWEVDKRSVINPTQARALLDAVRAQRPSGPPRGVLRRLYYSGLRPEEANRVASARR
jgi:hypothetical protein